jgi:hypothetical protein
VRRCYRRADAVDVNDARDDDAGDTAPLRARAFARVEV